jgi:hypothetical protein
MKRLLLFLMALMLMAGFAFATPAVAGKKDVLVIGMPISDIISLDPAKAFEFSGVGIEVQMYDRLLDFPAGKFDIPEMSLAESVKVSDDGRTFTFKLKEGRQVPQRQRVDRRGRGLLLHPGGQPEGPALLHPDPVRNHPGITKGGGQVHDLGHPGQEVRLGHLSTPACPRAWPASWIPRWSKQHVKKTDKYPEGDFGLDLAVAQLGGLRALQAGLLGKERQGGV